MLGLMAFHGGPCTLRYAEIKPPTVTHHRQRNKIWSGWEERSRPICVSFMNIVISSISAVTLIKRGPPGSTPTHLTGGKWAWRALMELFLCQALMKLMYVGINTERM